MSREKPVLRAIKLLSLIERNSSGLRVADMAEQLGAPLRAVYRYLHVLQQIRVPLYTDKNGRESHWKLDPAYRSRLSIPFTLSELLSLYFAQDSLRPLEGTVLFDSFNNVFEKVRANIPRALFKQMLDLRGGFLSAIPVEKDYRTYREFIRAIQDGIEHRKTLRLLYHPRDQHPTEREVDPYAIHLRNGSLYLIGYCHARKDVRSFLVDRMQKIKQADRDILICSESEA